MSHNMLEIRTVYRLNGRKERMYRIGTAEWVTITHYDESVAFQYRDGSYDVRPA